ncbi:MAG TPA: peptidylprolyl isomerase, partial [Acidobacteriaceae bacterium]|nr:peptidylprolyl isomerase [Acidobacteriaceae bacterium]
SYEDFKANIRNNIITQNVVREEVGRKLQPSQAQMEAYYREHKDSFTQQESVHLSEILIPTDATATEAQLAAADVQAKDIEAKLKSGGDFAQLAKQYSGGPTAQQGGDLGEFHRGALAKVLEDQTFSLPVGSYTQPIRTKQGYVILKVTQHVPGGTPTLQQVEPQVEEAVYMEQIPSAVRKYLTLLREQAYIDIRPGFVDSGASPNETKPIYSAYAAPQSKKKKKQDKSRLETNVRYTRYHKKSLGAAPIAATAVGSTTGTSSASSSVSLTPVSALSKKKIKKEKIRFGRAPLNRVSEEQVATSDESAVNAPPEAEAADANLSADVQPLGPDLTHTPGQQVKKGKTRLSDQAKLTHIRGKNSSKHSRNRKSKVAPNRANAPTPDEQAAQKVQSAPLGLEGDTSKKAKHKKTTGKPGEKTRLGDQRQNKSTDTQSNQAPATPVSSSSSSAGSSTPQQQ